MTRTTGRDASGVVGGMLTAWRLVILMCAFATTTATADAEAYWREYLYLLQPEAVLSPPSTDSTFLADMRSVSDSVHQWRHADARSKLGDHLDNEALTPLQRYLALSFLEHIDDRESAFWLGTEGPRIRPQSDWRERYLADYEEQHREYQIALKTYRRCSRACIQELDSSCAELQEPELPALQPVRTNEIRMQIRSNKEVVTKQQRVAITGLYSLTKAHRNCRWSAERRFEKAYERLEFEIDGMDAAEFVAFQEEDAQQTLEQCDASIKHVWKFFRHDVFPSILPSVRYVAGLRWIEALRTAAVYPMAVGGIENLLREASVAGGQCQVAQLHVRYGDLYLGISPELAPFVWNIRPMGGTPTQPHPMPLVDGLVDAQAMQQAFHHYGLASAYAKECPATGLHLQWRQTLFALSERKLPGVQVLAKVPDNRAGEIVRWQRMLASFLNRDADALVKELSVLARQDARPLISAFVYFAERLATNMYSGQGDSLLEVDRLLVLEDALGRAGEPGLQADMLDRIAEKISSRGLIDTSLLMNESALSRRIALFVRDDDSRIDSQIQRLGELVRAFTAWREAADNRGAFLGKVLNEDIALRWVDELGGDFQQHSIKARLIGALASLAEPEMGSLAFKRAEEAARQTKNALMVQGLVSEILRKYRNDLASLLYFYQQGDQVLKAGIRDHLQSLDVMSVLRGRLSAKAAALAMPLSPGGECLLDRSPDSTQTQFLTGPFAGINKNPLIDDFPAVREPFHRLEDVTLQALREAPVNDAGEIALPDFDERFDGREFLAEQRMWEDLFLTLNELRSMSVSQLRQRSLDKFLHEFVYQPSRLDHDEWDEQLRLRWRRLQSTEGRDAERSSWILSKATSEQTTIDLLCDLDTDGRALLNDILRDQIPDEDRVRALAANMDIESISTLLTLLERLQKKGQLEPAPEPEIVKDLDLSPGDDFSKIAIEDFAFLWSVPDEAFLALTLGEWKTLLNLQLLRDGLSSEELRNCAESAVASPLNVHLPSDTQVPFFIDSQAELAAWMVLYREVGLHPEARTWLAEYDQARSTDRLFLSERSGLPPGLDGGFELQLQRVLLGDEHSGREQQVGVYLDRLIEQNYPLAMQRDRAVIWRLRQLLQARIELSLQAGDVWRAFYDHYRLSLLMTDAVKRFLGLSVDSPAGMELAAIERSLVYRSPKNMPMALSARRSELWTELLHQPQSIASRLPVSFDDFREDLAQVGKQYVLVFYHLNRDEKAEAWVYRADGRKLTYHRLEATGQLVENKATVLDRWLYVRVYSNKVEQIGRELHELLIQPWYDEQGSADKVLVFHQSGNVRPLRFPALVAGNGARLVRQHGLAVLDDWRFDRIERPGGGKFVYTTESNAPYVGEKIRAIASKIPPDEVAIVSSKQDGAELLKRARLVHFATHGILSPRNTFESYILSQNREPLEAWWLANNVSGDTEMVFMSACETQKEKALEGDLGKVVYGNDSMASLLHKAGVSWVVATPWKASDRYSAGVIDGFYKALFESGASYPNALRTAMIGRGEASKRLIDARLVGSHYVLSVRGLGELMESSSLGQVGQQHSDDHASFQHASH